MKIIILSATTGGGHMRAANAIKDYLESLANEVIVLDTLEYINPILNKTITEGYEYLAKKKPGLYKVLYDSANKRSIMQAIANVNNFISKKLAPLIDEYNPDIIVTTHPFSTEMASRLRGINRINTPIVCIMTDYAPHRTWISENVDAYVVANDDMIKSMYDMGVPYWKVYPYGIPIDGAFYTKKDREIVLEEMGLSPKLPTILIMAGSFGVKNILSIYRDILEISMYFQIVVITGRNEELYNSIEEAASEAVARRKKVHGRKLLRNYMSRLKSKTLRLIKVQKNLDTDYKINQYIDFHKKNTRVLYFTKEVDKYMQTADLIITKPGGLTITEALACNLPMAIFDAIPGQEKENADFLVSNNMAIRLEKGADSIRSLLQNSEKLKSMKSSCEIFNKSDSLKKINLLLERIYSSKYRGLN